MNLFPPTTWNLYAEFCKICNFIHFIHAQKMTMDFTFPRYLLAKQGIDDRALNMQVYNALKGHLPAKPIRWIEIGAGIGTMPARLLRWGLLTSADYIAVDNMAENVEFALDWFPRWTKNAGLLVERPLPNQVRSYDGKREVLVQFEHADIFEFIDREPPRADVLIAHAVLDLLPLPDSLERLFTLLNPGGLAWLTLNFDGVTIFEPVIDANLDSKIESLYHKSMDMRPTGGDSQTGRNLFVYLNELGVEILAAGASDWVVYPRKRQYTGDETYFLHFILNFFEQSLTGHSELPEIAFEHWLALRRKQVEQGELIYIAHQVDFLVRI